MSFESALLTPERPYDLDRVRTHLAGLPYAFVDPHGSGVFHLSGTAAAARHAADQRRADPDRFPPGVLVTLRPDGVLVDQRPLPDAQARGREFVAWLLRTGRWRARTEYGDQGIIDSADALYPQPLPDPASLADDPFAPPPLSGRLWSWAGPPAGSGPILTVAAGGAVRLEASGTRCDGQLSAGALDAFRSAIASVDLDACDIGAHDPATTECVQWEDAGGENAFAYFDTDTVPEELKAVVALFRGFAHDLREAAAGRDAPTLARSE